MVCVHVCVYVYVSHSNPISAKLRYGVLKSHIPYTGYNSVMMYTATIELAQVVMRISDGMQNCKRRYDEVGD